MSLIFLPLSCPTNHLRTPQIYFVTLWRGPTPSVNIETLVSLNWKSEWVRTQVRPLIVRYWLSFQLRYFNKNTLFLGFQLSNKRCLYLLVISPQLMSNCNRPFVHVYIGCMLHTLCLVSQFVPLTPCDGLMVQPSSAVAVVESISTSAEKRKEKVITELLLCDNVDVVRMLLFCHSPITAWAHVAQTLATYESWPVNMLLRWNYTNYTIKSHFAFT